MISEPMVWKKLDELKDVMFVRELRRYLNDQTLGSPLSVVDVGMIYDVQVQDNNVHIVFIPYSRGYVQITRATSPIRQKVLEIDGVGDVTVECIWEPQWTADRLSTKAREVLGFKENDPVEGKLHVRSKIKAAADALPYDERTLARDPLVIPAASWKQLNHLPNNKLAAWRGGWQFFTQFSVEEKDGLSRQREPIHLEVYFDAKQVTDPAKEIRLIEEESGKEIPCQVYDQEIVGNQKKYIAVFLAEVNANQRKEYSLLCGNPSACCWAPIYRTDLVTWGEGYALEIENSYYVARLSPVMGHLRDVQFKRWGQTALSASPDPTPINITDASNDPKAELDLAWHGEDFCIHWCPDFMNQLRYRVTNWPEPPNYTVTRGPLCTTIKRWGYPVSPIYPALPQTAVSIEVIYTFYSELPYFTMSTRFDVEEEIDISYVRNDQWLFGGAFTNMHSMMESEEVKQHSAATPFDQNPALVGFFNDNSKDAFSSLRLSYGARGFPQAYRPSDLNLSLDHGGIWQRGAFAAETGGSVIQPGAMLDEYNAYLCYNLLEDGDHNQPRDWYNLLRRPLEAVLNPIRFT
jgi:metal-sulfur cluster biosynthetic enzyme